MRLKGKIAIITGAGSGIGKACALAFAKEGAKVALVGRRRDRLESVAREIGDSAFVAAGDLASKDDLARIVADTAKHFGSINVLLNNAGVLHPGTAEETTEAEWEETFNVNVRGVWRLSCAVLPHLREAGGGSIINIASVLGLFGSKIRAAYAASKGAVVLLTKSMAMDHAVDKIRVNCICPAFVETELTRAAYGKLPDPAAAIQARLAQHPIGRLGQPQDIAGAALFLASEESSWVTGAAFPIDGGYTAA